MKLLILFILSIIIAVTIWIGVSLLAYYLKYLKGDSIVHFINVLQANHELHQLKVKRQIQANTSTDLVQIAEVEEVAAEDVPPCWAVKTNSNYTDYITTEIQSF